MWQARRMYFLNQNFRWKSSVKIKEEFLVPEGKPYVSRSTVSKARSNITENLKKLKEKNLKLQDNCSKRTVKSSVQNKTTAKIFNLDKIHKIEDNHYKTALVQCFTQSCYSEFFTKTLIDE